MTLDSINPIDSMISLPDGYTQRPAINNEAEAQAVADVYTQACQARGENETFTAEILLRSWSNPHWDINASSQVCLDPHGRIVGYLMVGDRLNPTHPAILGEVLPGEHWETIMRVLLAWAERRSLLALERCLPEECFAPIIGCGGENRPLLTLLESLGYKKTRYAHHMFITLNETPTVPPLPQGFTLSTFEYPTQLESLVIAQDDIWQDHYGYFSRPLADRMEDWTRRIETDPEFDPTMWFIAYDQASGKIAGLVLCSLHDPTRPSDGYISIVGVRRAYRKHGLAQAMLIHAFGEFWARGQKTIGLGVDADSLTGATRLYERVGMSATEVYIRLEKEIRPGIERMNSGR